MAEEGDVSVEGSVLVDVEEELGSLRNSTATPTQTM